MPLPLWSPYMFSSSFCHMTISGAVGFRAGSESEIPASAGSGWMVVGDVGFVLGYSIEHKIMID